MKSYSFSSIFRWPGLTAAAGVSVLCVARMASASTTTLVQDNFSGSTGSLIAGRTPDTTDLSGADWVQYGVTGNNGGNVISPTVSDAISLSGSGSALFPTYTGSGAYSELGAAIGFHADTSTSAGDLSVQATINAKNNGAEWVAVGIGPSNPTSNYGPWAGGPWALVTHTGEVQFFATGGTGTPVVTDTSAENSTGTHTIKLTYDPSTKTVVLSVDGTAVTGGSYTYAAPIDLGSVFVDDRYKFSYTLPTNATDYGSFSGLVVTGTPAAVVPEPAAVGMLGLGVAGGMLQLGRRRKA